MARGVNERFLHVLHNERRVSRRSLWAAIVALPIAYFLAELGDEPFVGPVVWTAALALLLGSVAGAILTRRRHRAYEDSIKASWNAWMRGALAHDRIDAVARGVARRPPRSRSLAWFAAAFVVAHAIVFAMLWVSAPGAILAAGAMAASSGLAVGWLASLSVVSLRWAGEFARTLDDMVAQGDLAVWGEI